MKKDFIPRRNSNLNTFVNNFITRLDLHSQDLAMNDQEINEAKKILQNHMRTFANMISLRAESKAATEEFNSSRENTINLIRRLSNQIKSSKKYDTGIGADFGIINRYSPVTDFSRHKPELKAKLNGSEVIIRYQAYGADGLTLYSKRGNETKFTKLNCLREDLH
ncbi:MAG: hypothetical protein IPL53_06315 [Ignavibacteria bacterium]|nr:hypothetical protein [Ignavibacteria bacterium]